MPTYRLTAPGEPPELLQADTARREGVHTVLRGTVVVMGLPREIVVRRAPASVVVEVLEDNIEPDARASWASWALHRPLKRGRGPGPSGPA